MQSCKKREREKWCIHFITRNLAKIYMKLLCTIAEKTLYKSFYIHHWCHAWPFKARFFSVRSYNRAATWDYHIDLLIKYASLFCKIAQFFPFCEFMRFSKKILIAWFWPCYADYLAYFMNFQCGTYTNAQNWEKKISCKNKLAYLIDKSMW